MTEQRTYNEEKNGYDIIGPCFHCGSIISYFVDEDGNIRDVEPLRTSCSHTYTHFSRSLCAFGNMHNFCVECGEAVDNYDACTPDWKPSDFGTQESARV